jgi:hypothetical protein
MKELLFWVALQNGIQSQRFENAILDEGIQYLTRSVESERFCYAFKKSDVNVVRKVWYETRYNEDAPRMINSIVLAVLVPMFSITGIALFRFIIMTFDDGSIGTILAIFITSLIAMLFLSVAVKYLFILYRHCQYYAMRWYSDGS